MQRDAHALGEHGRRRDGLDRSFGKIGSADDGHRDLSAQPEVVGG
jgi:hypothetical protein